MNDLFYIRANCVIFSVNLENNKRYIFSLDSDNIVLPYLTINSTNINHINLSIINSLKNYILDDTFNAMNIGIQPQIINAHCSEIASEDNVMNLIFGMLVDQYTNIRNSFWIDFEVLKSTKYHNLFFDVIRNLR
jgi:hypothetical protein